MDSLNILISIKPEFATKILDGNKTVELRKRFSNKALAGIRMMIYSSSPEKEVVGYVNITAVSTLSVKDIWQKYKDASCVSKLYFDKYYHSRDTGVVVHLSNPKKIKEKIKLLELKKIYNIHPPQSYRYLSDRVFNNIIGYKT